MQSATLDDDGEAAAAAASRTALDEAEPAWLVVVGASAGGIAALRDLLGALPADYRGSVCVVMHLAAESPSQLPAILARAGSLPVVAAEDGAPIVPGRVVVAPPDRHLLVERGRLRVLAGPRENRHRPAIDPLFRSAAWAYGSRVVAVVLSGALDDGTAGLWAVKSCGGVTVVQEPAEAATPEMPMNALLHNDVDHRLGARDIAALLVELAQRAPPGERDEPPESVGRELRVSRHEGTIDDMGKLGRPTPFTCPSCRGALWELEEGGHLRYRCHTGHAWSSPALLRDQDVAIEESLYIALRAVEEKAEALRRLAQRLSDPMISVKRDYEERSRALDRSADTLRDLLTGLPDR